MLVGGTKSRKTPTTTTTATLTTTTTTTTTTNVHVNTPFEVRPYFWVLGIDCADCVLNPNLILQCKLPAQEYTLCATMTIGCKFLSHMLSNRQVHITHTQSERPSVCLHEQTTERTRERPSERTTERPNERSNERSCDRAIERAIVRESCKVLESSPET